MSNGLLKMSLEVKGCKANDSGYLWVCDYHLFFENVLGDSECSMIKMFKGIVNIYSIPIEFSLFVLIFR